MKVYLLISHFFILASCQKDVIDVPAPSSVTISDVSYGSHPRQKMDVYLPGKRSTDFTKVLILIHGGGWAEGDKSDFNPYVALLQQKLPGYAIFNINYRLAGNGNDLFPSQENDIKSAIEYIHAKRLDYKISDQFAYLGASAGGHLALLQAYKYSIPLKPRAVISFFGPTDLAALFQSNLMAGMILAEVTGGSPFTHPDIYQQSSPISFVSNQSPPTMLLHGGMDPLVPPAQSEQLRDLLKNANADHEYVFYPSEKHGWTGNTLNDSFDKIASFLEQHMD